MKLCHFLFPIAPGIFPVAVQCGIIDEPRPKKVTSSNYAPMEVRQILTCLQYRCSNVQNSKLYYSDAKSKYCNNHKIACRQTTRAILEQTNPCMFMCLGGSHDFTHKSDINTRNISQRYELFLEANNVFDAAAYVARMKHS